MAEAGVAAGLQGVGQGRRDEPDEILCGASSHRGEGESRPHQSYLWLLPIHDSRYPLAPLQQALTKLPWSRCSGLLSR